MNDDSRQSDPAGGTIETRLRALGIIVPPVPAPVGSFELGVVHRNLLFLSGQGPLQENGTLARGKVGEGVDADTAYGHARLTGLVLISAMRTLLGDLDRVTRIVKVLGMVNAAPGFDAHPRVINGCSDLFREIFGAQGNHARSAIGVASLPGGITVEIEAVVAFDGVGG